MCLRYTYDVTLLNLAVATVVGRSEDRGQDSMSSSNDPRQCYSEPFAWIIAMDNCEIRKGPGSSVLQAGYRTLCSQGSREHMHINPAPCSAL